ncbi:unnamed protein product [Prunus armeniaca]
MGSGNDGATSKNLRFEPVETADYSRVFRGRKLVGLDQDVETKLLGPVSRDAVAGSDGGVDFSVRVNSDGGESSREREKRRTGKRERKSEMKLKNLIFTNTLFELFTILPPKEISSPKLRYNSDSSLPPVYEFISEPPTQPNHLWSQNPSGQKNDRNTLPQGIYVDEGNVAIILQLSVVQHMSMETKINKSARSLTGFNGVTSVIVDMIDLDVYFPSVISLQTFMIIDEVSPYNGILGRPGLARSTSSHLPRIRKFVIQSLGRYRLDQQRSGNGKRMLNSRASEKQASTIYPYKSSISKGSRTSRGGRKSRS